MKPLNYRLASFIAFTLFLAWHTPWILNQITEEPDYYTAWNFHECYTKTLDATYCTQATIHIEGKGYTYYPPVTHLLAKAIPLPAKQSLQVLALLVFLGLMTAMAVGTNSFWAPLAFFFVAPQLWGTFLRGGMIPFFLLMFFLLFAVFWWHKLGWKAKLALCALAAFTHVYGGWFFLAFALVLELWPRRTALAFGLVASVLIGIGLDVTVPYQEYRGWMIVVLFACVLFGEAITKLEAEIALRQAMA